MTTVSPVISNYRTRTLYRVLAINTNAINIFDALRFYDRTNCMNDFKRCTDNYPYLQLENEWHTLKTDGNI